MRVRISYGMELEDIPEQIQDLLDKQIDEMQKTKLLLERAETDASDCKENSNHIVATLEKVRNKLGKLDMAIADIQSIMVGLANHYNGEKNVSERRPIVDPSGDTTTQTKDPRQG